MADEKNNSISLGQTIASAAAGSGFGLAANVLGNAVGSIFNDMSAERAFQRQKDMFDYVSDYNKPANQVARLKEAGIAPATAYGGINQSQSAPTMNTGNFQSNNNVDPFAFQQLRNLRAEEENLRSQAYKNKMEGDKAKSQTKGQNIDNEYKPKVYENQIKLNESLTSLNGASEEKVRQEIPLVTEITKRVIQETSNLVEQSKFIGAQINKCNEEIENLKKQRDVYTSQILLNEAHARLSNLQSEYQRINNQIRTATMNSEVQYTNNRFDQLKKDYASGKSELNGDSWNEFLSVSDRYKKSMQSYSDYLSWTRRNTPLTHSVSGSMNANYGILGAKVGSGVSLSESTQSFGN